MSETIDDARKLIESRITEIQAEAKELERALEGLGRASGRRISTPGRSPAGVWTAGRGAASGQERARRAPRGQRRDELLAAIEATPGARPSELAATIGVRPTQVSVLIAKLRSEKLIVKSGKGYAPKS